MFLSYNASDASGVLTPLGPDDLDNDWVTFYWADTGNARTVTVTFNVGGTQCSKSETFNVLDVPVPTLTLQLGTVQLDPILNPGEVALLDAAGFGTEGLILTGSVATPAPFMTGQWQFGQLITVLRTWKVEATGACAAKSSSGVAVCDDPWPYSTGSMPIAPPYPADGMTVCTVVDSPGVPLASLSQVVGTNSWSMYVMFLPAQDPPAAGPSAWVPLRILVWACDWCAQKQAGKWVLVTGSEVAFGWVPTSTHPTWSDFFSNLPDMGVACPPPCVSSS